MKINKTWFCELINKIPVAQTITYLDKTADTICPAEKKTNARFKGYILIFDRLIACFWGSY